MYVDEGAIWLLRGQHDQGAWRVTFEALEHEAGCSACRRQGVDVFVAFDEGEVIRPGKFKWRNICNQVRQSRSIVALGAGQQDDLGHSQTSGGTEECSFFHIPALAENHLRSDTGHRVRATGVANI